MSTLDVKILPDVQSTIDKRNIVINQVGVKGVKFPIQILNNNNIQHSVANIDMYVELAANIKGTHMSRFLEVLHNFNQPISFDSLKQLMQIMLEKLEANSGFIRIQTTFFMQKQAPVSKVSSLMDYELNFEISANNNNISISQQVLVPVKSLCPCSKQISDYGAHNQRSHIIIKATLKNNMPVEEIIKIAEKNASCELWGILKRSDEKYVTEKAYENPKFVEDLVRDIACELNNEERILNYELSSENFESIHNHSAYAYISKK